jgi:hypothetical protein
MPPVLCDKAGYSQRRMNKLEFDVLKAILIILARIYSEIQYRNRPHVSVKYGTARRDGGPCNSIGEAYSFILGPETFGHWYLFPLPLFILLSTSCWYIMVHKIKFHSRFRGCFFSQILCEILPFLSNCQGARDFLILRQLLALYPQVIFMPFPEV